MHITPTCKSIFTRVTKSAFACINRPTSTVRCFTNLHMKPSPPLSPPIHCPVPGIMLRVRNAFMRRSLLMPVPPYVQPGRVSRGAFLRGPLTPFASLQSIRPESPAALPK